MLLRYLKIQILFLYFVKVIFLKTDVEGSGFILRAVICGLISTVRVLKANFISAKLNTFNMAPGFIYNHHLISSCQIKFFQNIDVLTKLWQFELFQSKACIRE